MHTKYILYACIHSRYILLLTEALYTSVYTSVHTVHAISCQNDSQRLINNGKNINKQCNKSFSPFSARKYIAQSSLEPPILFSACTRVRVRAHAYQLRFFGPSALLSLFLRPSTYVYIYMFPPVPSAALSVRFTVQFFGQESESRDRHRAAHAGTAHR